MTYLEDASSSFGDDLHNLLKTSGSWIGLSAGELLTPQQADSVYLAIRNQKAESIELINWFISHALQNTAWIATITYTFIQIYAVYKKHKNDRKPKIDKDDTD